VAILRVEIAPTGSFKRPARNAKLQI
jgi:hypothetical protein